MTPKKPEWFELTESGDSYAGIKKVNKRLPIATLAVAAAVVLGGSIFATTNNEPSAVADTPAASQSVAASQPSATNSATTSYTAPAPVAVANKKSAGVNSLPVPTVTNVPQRGDDDDDDDDEHEGRKGKGKGGYRDHDDDEEDDD